MSFLRVEYEVLRRIAEENGLEIVKYMEKIDDILEERQQQPIIVDCEGKHINLTRVKIFVRENIKMDSIIARPAYAPMRIHEIEIAVRIIRDTRARLANGNFILGS